MASFPNDRQKRIVLFSDGNQNAGDALREARIASAQDVDVDVVLLAAAQGHEIMVEQLIVPTHVRKNANFLVRAIITSDIAQNAKLIASRSNCERLNVGCVIVTGGERKNRLVAAGYNGFLPGTPHA